MYDTVYEIDVELRLSRSFPGPWVCTLPLFVRLISTSGHRSKSVSYQRLCFLTFLLASPCCPVDGSLPDCSSLSRHRRSSRSFGLRFVLDAMRIGGNKNAQSFFRKHGMTDMYGKIEKKYTSKAAQSYKSELGKLVEAAAAKRGEGAPVSESLDQNLDLLANLDLADKAGKDDAATTKSAAPAPEAKPTAKLASSMPGASKLVVTPPSSGNAPKLVLRKPAGSTGGINMLKKKPNASVGKLKVNKLTMKPAGAVAESNPTDAFDSFDPTKPEEQKEAEESSESKNGYTENTTVPAVQPSPVAPATSSLAAPKQQTHSSTSAPAAAAKQFSMKAGVDKMKAMNSDFFSGF